MSFRPSTIAVTVINKPKDSSAKHVINSVNDHHSYHFAIALFLLYNQPSATVNN